MTFKTESIKGPLVLLLILSSGLSACSNQPQLEAPSPEIVSHVAVARAEKTTVPDVLEAVGTVRSAQTTQVASQMTGTITEIRVREGDSVQEDQVLAVVDPAQSQAATYEAAAAAAAAEKEVSAAESDFKLAESTRKRYQQLYDKKSVSPQEFDEINARYQSAAARLDLTRAKREQASAALAQSWISLSYTQIRAPFDGVITQKQAETGMLASPGMPIFTIEDTRKYRLEALVDENDIGVVHMGQRVPVALDALPNLAIPGKVAEIIPAVDPASRSFLVKIDLPANPRFRSGLFGRAHFSRGKCSAVLIPSSAVVLRGQLRGVYVIDAGQIAGLRYVTLGKAVGQQVEVLSGLEGGETIIAAPGDREFGGKRVEAGQ